MSIVFLGDDASMSFNMKIDVVNAVKIRMNGIALILLYENADLLSIPRSLKEAASEY